MRYRLALILFPIYLLQVWNALLERGAASEQRPRVARTPVPAAARARSGCHLADNVDAVVTLERACSAYQVTATTTQQNRNATLERSRSAYQAGSMHE